MRTITLKSEFVMSVEDLKFLDELPANLPETKLSKKQIEQLGTLYHKYISKIDNLDWSPPLVQIEMSEKWPSGPRMKRHEAQRICLGFLASENARNKMNQAGAVRHFFSSITSRPAAARLVSKVWNTDTIYK